ncbi:phage major capsid protein [Mycobacterium sp. SMC-4]|uniref:phage major capsid protein n=1 Tax=Mycobacterium sp. SMC-4 TaxID=2857059 RepID=UPI003D00EBD3
MLCRSSRLSIQTGVLDLADPDSLIDGLAAAQGNHVNPTHWVMTPASFAAIRKIHVGTDDRRYVIEPNTIANGVGFQLFGLPVIITDFIPNTGTAPGKARVALADMSMVVVARDVNAEVKILDQTFGDYDSIGIRCVARFDVAVLQAKAVTLLTEA